jgi:hypothetical protein
METDPPIEDKKEAPIVVKTEKVLTVEEKIKE